jgi:hypothetical protein
MKGIAIFIVNKIRQNLNQSRCRDMGGRFIRGGGLTQPNRSTSDSGGATNQLVLSTTGCSGPLSDGGRIHCSMRRSQRCSMDSTNTPGIRTTEYNPNNETRQRSGSENDPDVSISLTNETYRTPLSLCERRGAEWASKDYWSTGSRELCRPTNEGGALASTRGMETDNWGDIFTADELEWMEMVMQDLESTELESVFE